MDGKYLYEMANDQLNLKDRKQYLSTLTEEQRKLYTRYNNKVRQDKFKAKEENKERYNEIRNKHIKELRTNDPEKMKAQNIKDVNAFRGRTKVKEQVIKDKSVNVLIGAYKAHKARKELKTLAEESVKTIKETPKKKRGRPLKPK